MIGRPTLQGLLRRFLVLTLALAPIAAHAGGGNGVSAGLILSQDTSARAASLAGTVQSLPDDVSAFGYNPASLSSLEREHAVVAFQRGLVDDSFSQIQYGHAMNGAGLGASVSLYQGGQMDFIMGSTRKSVQSQRDVAASVGYAKQVGVLSLGVAGKYLSSEIAETENASTYAADFGAVAPVGKNIRVAAAYQNLGAKLKYGDDQKSEIPAIARFGASYALAARMPVTFLVDFPYLVNEQRMDAAVGAETYAGPVAFRVGYRSGVDLGGLTAGAGLDFNQFSFDYAFGLMRELDSTHRVSLSFRFGGVDGRPHSADFSNRLPPAGSKHDVYTSGIDVSKDKLPERETKAPLKPAPIIVKPAEPVPVFQGPGRGDCPDGSKDSSTIFYGQGRSDCGQK